MLPGERIGQSDPPEWRAVRRAVLSTLTDLATETPTIVASLLSVRVEPITDQLTVAKALLETELTEALGTVHYGSVMDVLAESGFRPHYATWRRLSADWARAHAGAFVRSVSLEQRAAIALRVEGVLREIASRRPGASFAVPSSAPSSYRGIVETATRRIRPLVGLTPAQMGYVENYRRELERSLVTGNYRAPNARRLSANIRTLSEGRIDRLVDGYAKRWRTHRAETIAATEVHTSLMAGRRLAYETAGRSGRLSGAMLVWVTQVGACHLCAPLNGQIVDVIGGSFRAGGWSAETPPRHPRCRCGLDLVEMTPAGDVDL